MAKKKKEEEEIIIDYVASGFAASFRLASPYPDYEELISKHLAKSSEYLKHSLGDIVKISGLFNAYTEETFAERVEEGGQEFRKLFPDGMYADSGGLQVVTQGKQITPAQRKKIYEVQAKYADYAMSFDEIPAEMKMIEDPVTGEIKKVRVNFEDLNKIERYGKKAGDNLKEQIAYFDSIDSACKIFPIVQGQDFAKMSAYTNGMLSQLDDHELDKLECLAVGGVNNEFELLERARNIYNMDIPDKLKGHFHALGVTGFRKLLPILLGAKNGLLPGMKKISFDSTTFTKSYLLGSVQPSLADYQSGKGKQRSLGKKRNKFIEDYYAEMFEWWKDNPDNIFEDAEDLLQHSMFHGQFNNPKKPDLPESERFTTGAQQYKNLSLMDGVKTIVQKHVYIYYNTYKFITILEAYLHGEVEMEVFMDGYKQLDYLKWLEKIKDPKELDHFFQDVYKSVKMVGKTEANGDGVVDFMFDPVEEVIEDKPATKKKAEKKKVIVEIDAVEATNSLF